MIRLEYDKMKAGMRVSWVVTDGCMSSSALKGLLDAPHSNDDQGRRWISQNSKTLTIIRKSLDECIEAEKKNEAHRESTSHQQ